MSNSTHCVEIVPVELKPHPDADTLSVVEIFGGYTYVAKTADWQGVTKAAYIPADNTVDVSRPEFLWLADQAKSDGRYRIKAKKLRGIVSFGLLVPVPDDVPIGDDWTERLGVEHYNPPEPGEQKQQGAGGSNDEAPAPDVNAPKYDLDACRKYHRLFEAGEPVIVTEKLDGANARYVFFNGEMHCGSRTGWKKEFADTSHITVEYLIGRGTPEDKAVEAVERLRNKPQKQNQWWAALRRHPEIEAFCRANPGTVVFGELYGNTNCIKYGIGQDRLAVFDLLKDGCWHDYQEMSDLLNLAGVPLAPLFNPASELLPPIVQPIPFDFEKLCEMAEGPTLVPGAKAGTIREGIVISPIKERTAPRLGRVKLKLVSSAFLEKYR